MIGVLVMGHLRRRRRDRRRQTVPSKTARQVLPLLPPGPKPGREVAALLVSYALKRRRGRCCPCALPVGSRAFFAELHVDTHTNSNTNTNTNTNDDPQRGRCCPCAHRVKSPLLYC